MPPNLKKMKRHIARIKLGFLNFIDRFPIKKLTRIFSVCIISLCGVMPLLKGHNEIWKSRYLKTYYS